MGAPPSVTASRRHTGRLAAAMWLGAALLSIACQEEPPPDRIRVSGQVEATSVRVAAEVGGRVTEVAVKEGDRVARDAVVAHLDTRDLELALRRAAAERTLAAAQLTLLEAGARLEDISQAEAQVEGAAAERRAAAAELAGAEMDLERFETLLRANSGSRKQRDDALTRRDVTRQHVSAAGERERAATEVLMKLRAGARAQEIEVARARVSVVDTQMAALRKNLEDATVRAPIDGIVAERLVEPGEIVPPGAALLVVTDLDAAWADVFVDEPDVPRLRIGQAATVFTDAGDAGMAGTVTFIASRAEFTPRNVQTAEERSQLVYRVRVSVDNREGILKEGMPVEAELPLDR